MFYHIHCKYIDRGVVLVTHNMHVRNMCKKNIYEVKI